MEENSDLAQLEELLCADLGEKVQDCNDKLVNLHEIDIFKSSGSNTQGETSSHNSQSAQSALHNGDTDSSDDEERRNYTERKYSEYGTEIKKALDHKESEALSSKIDFETRLRQSNRDQQVSRQSSFMKKSELATEPSRQNQFCAPESNANLKTKGTDVFADPIFGIRITKPLISSTAFLDRMQGKEAINMMRVKRHVENEDLSKDWVIAGVIVRKSATRKSQKGSQFLIWTLSDLKDDLKTVSMFLFSKAYNDYWKTSEGTVVAVLNPNVLDRSQNSSDQACLSVDNPDRVMILGQSKDLGVCKSKKKSGEPCTAFINISQCQHCIYHVKAEYQSFARRQELQSSTMGKGLVNLQKKVLGKDTVIYGGKAYSAAPASNTKKVKERDQNRLMSLSDYYKSEGDKLMSNKAPYGSGSLKNNSSILHSPALQRKSDAERLNKLTGSSPSSSLADRIASSPKLGKGFSLKGSGVVDLNMAYGQKAAEKTKANAIKLIQQCGGLTKNDPNNIKGTEAGKKRALEKLNGSSSDENDTKKPKPSDDTPKTIMSERFKKILEASSIHQNLIKQHEDSEQEKYFSNLEKKEAMEEKMLSTFKLACKAVRCIKCKYTAFSAAQLCKDERHPLKVLDSFKRFFKCADCNNRTVSLDIIPLNACSNCKSSRWVKAPMMREKKVILSDQLSIRGEEETYIGGAITGGKNLNLLIPDDS